MIKMMNKSFESKISPFLNETKVSHVKVISSEGLETFFKVAKISKLRFFLFSIDTKEAFCRFG